MLTILHSTHTTTIIQHKLLAYHNHILNTIISLGRKSCWTYCWALGYPYINMRSIMTMADEIKNKKPKEWKKKNYWIKFNVVFCLLLLFAHQFAFCHVHWIELLYCNMLFYHSTNDLPNMKYAFVLVHFCRFIFKCILQSSQRNVGAFTYACRWILNGLYV